MYANEAKGMKFPSMLIWRSSWWDNPPKQCDFPSNGQFSFDGPAMIPEYLSDTHVLVCPSDPDGLYQMESRWMVNGYVDPCALENTSYMYWGWAITPEHYLRTGGGGDNAPNAELGVDISEAVLAMAYYEILDKHETDLLTYGTNNFDEDLHFDHEDRGSMTVYRLKEGIERFFITDINNPAASSKAQSEIAVMYDTTATDVTQSSTWDTTYSLYNHVPGGANVLYMDGHVEFLKYPDKYPVSRCWSTIQGIIWTAMAT
jgi:prepilin-type processing-associated H-X9-DG protein